LAEQHQQVLRGAGMRKSTYRVNGISLSAVVEGPQAAPTVLLLHGFPDSSRLWHAQVLPPSGAHPWR
jgi:pimeloyl-ACP methyl ester carboxylesterase